MLMNDDSDLPVRFKVSTRSNVGFIARGLKLKKKFKMFSVSVFVVTVCLVPSIYGSAIPMWEYLSRGEKV